MRTARQLENVAAAYGSLHQMEGFAKLSRADQKEFTVVFAETLADEKVSKDAKMLLTVAKEVEKAAKKEANEQKRAHVAAEKEARAALALVVAALKHKTKKVAETAAKAAAKLKKQPAKKSAAKPKKVRRSCALR